MTIDDRKWYEDWRTLALKILLFPVILVAALWFLIEAVSQKVLNPPIGLEKRVEKDHHS